MSRGYSRVAIIGGDLKLEAHKNYAIKYFTYLGQDTQNVGNIDKETDIFTVVNVITKRLLTDGAILFFSYNNYLDRFISSLNEYKSDKVKYNIVTFNHGKDTSTHEYEAVGSYFSSLKNPENIAGKEFISSRLPLSMTISELIVNIKDVV